MKEFPRNDLTVLAITGEDRCKLLNNIVSANLRSFEDGQTQLACLLEVKGKMISDLWLGQVDQKIYAFVEKQFAQDAIETILKYKLAADVHISELEGSFVTSQFSYLENDSLVGPGAVKKINDNLVFRFSVPLGCFQLVLEKTHGKEASEDEFTAFRIQNGLPIFGIDLLQDHLPLECDFYRRGISFEKGCYVGQETIARVDSRGGNVARRLMGLVLEEKPQDLKIYFNDEVVGEVSSWATKGKRFVAMGLIHRKAFEKGQKVIISKREIEVQEFPLEDV